MIGNAILSKVFWNWVRVNPLASSLWWWAKRSTPLPTLLNLLEPCPTGIEIEVTTRCNLKCIMCEHTYWNEPKRDMSFEEFKSIVDQFPNLRWIGLTGIGTSFLNKDFLKMVEYVKSKGILVELFDSFTSVGEDTLRQLVELKLNRLVASIDAATKETYEKIRVGGDFDKVTNNIQTLCRLKREMGSRFPLLAFHYIVSNTNLHELLPYLDYVNSLTRGDKVTVSYTRILHQFEDAKDLFVEIPKELRERVDEVAGNYGIDIFWNADVFEVKPPISRCLEFFEPFIFVTGHVIPCCAGNEANRRDFQKETALGNILEQPFMEIWNGERYRSLRKMIRNGKVPPPCKNCCLYRLPAK